MVYSSRIRENPMNQQESWNYRAFLWHAALLAVTTTFTDINTVLPSLFLKLGGGELHLGILTGIMVGVPLAGQLLFAGWLHGRPRKKPYLLLAINLRVLAMALLAVSIRTADRWAPGAAFIVLYGELLLFTLSGAFAGISYLDLVGKSFRGGLRRRFVLLRQAFMSVGILLSALLTRWILTARDAPGSYVLLFGLASGALLLASLGFWGLREPVTALPDGNRGIWNTLRSIPGLLRADRNLRRYITAANLLGLGTVLLPFYVALTRRSYGLEQEYLGNLLLIQIGGMIAGNLIWPRVVKARGFKGMMAVWSVLGMLVPLTAVILAGRIPRQVFLAVFTLTGLYLGAQKVTSEAVLMEISNDHNRALYTGVFGTFNLTLALAPVVMGALVMLLGFTPVFLAASAAAVLAFPLTRGMVCPVDLPDAGPEING